MVGGVSVLTDGIPGKWVYKERGFVSRGGDVKFPYNGEMMGEGRSPAMLSEVMFSGLNGKPRAEGSMGLGWSLEECITLLVSVVSASGVLR